MLSLKVDRTEVIKVIEAHVKTLEKRQSDAEKALPKAEAAKVAAQENITKVALANFDKSTGEVSSAYVYGRKGRGHVTVVQFQVDEDKIAAAEEKANEANAEFQRVWSDANHLKGEIHEGKRDLSILKASSEPTVNIKTAGLAHYFG